jgi:DNA-binding NarL/FixJ family response regulator
VPDVLLVDDDQAYRRSLRAFLDATYDLRVVGEASGSADALRLLEELKPDALVVDLAMPGGDGLELAAKALAAAPGTSVVVVTGVGDEDQRRRAEELGAGWVPKGDPLLVENALRSLVSHR